MKSLFQNKTPDLIKLKISLIQVHDRQGQHNNKEKRPKGKIVSTKETKQEKNGTRKQKTASTGVEPGLSARASNSLTTAPQ